jgi:hypothetical protein
MTPTLRLGLSLVCAWTLLLAPRVSAAARTVANVDGAGLRGHATIGQDPILLHVWLSSTRITDVIHGWEPVLHVAAVDLDGDARPELIVSSRSALHVWDRTTHAFRPYRISRRQDLRRRLASIHCRASDAGPDGADLSPYEYWRIAPVLPAQASYEPLTRGAWREPSRPIRGPTLRPAFHPTAPRPPPAFAV